MFLVQQWTWLGRLAEGGALAPQTHLDAPQRGSRRSMFSLSVLMLRWLTQRERPGGCLQVVPGAVDVSWLTSIHRVPPTAHECSCGFPSRGALHVRPVAAEPQDAGLFSLEKAEKGP